MRKKRCGHYVMKTGEVCKREFWTRLEGKALCWKHRAKPQKEQGGKQ